MKLKDAFRFQNKLDELINNTQRILTDKDSITLTKRTYLYKKANPDAVNETVTIKPDTEFYKNINEMIAFAMHLMEQREQLSYKINESKRKLPIDLDSETSLNRYRQRMAETFRSMSRIKSTSTSETNSGVGYCFNNEGNQVSYRCDVEKVTTINFDRNLVRRYASRLSEKSDKASLEIDQVMIGCEVEFEPPFDVNSSFDEIFEDFIENFDCIK